ncbi:hypothetical protein LC609_29060 [Nostoc sp. XA013]|nr:hypothetical protein [Nostoc sp. XA013]
MVRKAYTVSILAALTGAELVRVISKVVRKLQIGDAAKPSSLRHHRCQSKILRGIFPPMETTRREPNEMR